MSDWVAGAGLSISEGSPEVSGSRPPTPATLASIYVANVDRRLSRRHLNIGFREGEAPAEPCRSAVSARREPRPPGFETASSRLALRQGTAFRDVKGDNSYGLLHQRVPRTSRRGQFMRGRRRYGKRPLPDLPCFGALTSSQRIPCPDPSPTKWSNRRFWLRFSELMVSCKRRLES